MNSIVLMAEILTEPQLRFTQDNNLEIATFTVSFVRARGSNEENYQVRVAAFGEVAKEVMDTYHAGDQVVIEGQLRMNQVTRNERKETQAEITARRVYGAAGSTAGGSSTLSGDRPRAASQSDPSQDSYSTPDPTPVTSGGRDILPDDIPF